MSNITAVIITLNEERNIGRALASLQWVDEIIVLDSGSRDATVQLARQAGARVETTEWRGYVRAKNDVSAMAGGAWILSLDADEEVTPELKEEIQAIIRNPGKAADGYRIPRKNHYLGRWIRHCGWYPDYQLRLWKRGKGQWHGGRVHESVQVDGTVTETRAALNHYTYTSIAEHLERMERYAGLHARDRFESGKRTGAVALAAAAPLSFFRLFILRLGFLDGVYGLLVSSMGAFYAMLKKARLWELQQRSDDESASSDKQMP